MIAALVLTLAQIADTQARCAFGSAAIRLRANIAKYAQELTKFKTSVLWGDEPTPAWPVGFTMPLRPSALNANVSM